jgi:hypothetical protein
VDSFWRTFGNQIERRNRFVQVPEISSADDFDKFLDLSNKDKIFGNKKVLIFVDEFDLLYHSENKAVIDSFLNVLRGIKQTKTTSSLHSFVGIGPFSILKLTGMSASPFNILCALRSPHYTETQVIELFDQVKEDYGNIFDDRVPIDVFERTSGHRGLIGLCGKSLLETLMKGRSFVSYEEWIEYASELLVNNLPEWPTMQKMIDTIQNPNSAKARQLLLTHFLPSLFPIKVTAEEENLAKFLTAEGALIDTNQELMFQIPSPLIRNLLMSKLIHHFHLKSLPKEPIPFFNGGNQLDVTEIIKISLRYFDLETLTLSINNAFKGSRAFGMSRNIPVPQEGVYHEQLYSIFLFWLQKPVINPSQKIMVWSEANVPNILNEVNDNNAKSRRCDLILNVNGGKKYVLEIMASDSSYETKKHLKDTLFYMNALNAQESWLIHFVATIDFDVKELIWSTVENVNMMYVFHDLDWKEAIILTKEKMGVNQVNVKLSN